MQPSLTSNITTNNIYKDIVLKVKFYKAQIIKDLLNKGISPETEEIDKRLNDIDISLSIFEHETIYPGSNVNVKRINQELKNIEIDLKFLYTLLHDLTITEIVKLKAFSDTHLDELENLSNNCKVRSQEEVNSTSLGKTLYFQHSNFDITTEHNIDTIELGPIEISQGSKIACIVNATNVENSNIIVNIVNTITGAIINISPYNYNQQSILLSKIADVNTYNISFSQNIILNSPLKLNINDMIINPFNKYQILAGADKIKITSADYNGLINRPLSTNMAYFENKTFIEFYTIGATEITFKFNKPPTHTNFKLNNHKVSNLDYIHYFFIECDKDFSFNFDLNKGNVYAVKEKGIIDNKNLLYAGNDMVSNFCVIETISSKKEIFQFSIKIINNNQDVDVQNIYVKEISSLGSD